MHRIDTNGNVNGLFSNGNPQAGQLATRLSADWFNDVQENILHVIEQAELAPEKGAYHQLYLAIVTLIAGAGGAGEEETDVPITREVNGGGLVTGGGALGANLTLTVAKALAAEIAAGVVDDKAITPLGLKTAFPASFGAAGYAKLPGGLIVQWGTGMAASNSTTIFTLPTTFPGACAWAGVEGGASEGDAQDNNPYVSGRGASSVSVYSSRDTGTAVNYVAIGY